MSQEQTISKTSIANNPIFMIAIILMSLVPMETGQAMNPIMGNIVQSFPDVSPSVISFIMSFPALASFIFAIVCGKLSLTHSRKSLTIVGLLFYIIGGTGAILVNNIYWIIGCRFVLGIGAGFCIPLSMGLIAEYYEGGKKANMMGYSTSVGNLGGAVFALAAGFIGVINWHFVFLLYLLPIVILVLLVPLLPNTVPTRNITQETGSTKEKHKMPVGVYILTAIAFLNFVLTLNVAMNLATMIMFEKMGNSSTAGIASSLMSFACFIAAIFFGRIFKLTKVHAITLAFIFAALSCFLISIATNIFVIYISQVLFGLCTSLLIPALNMSVSALSAESHQSFALGILNGGMNMGVFASSAVMAILFGIVGATNYRGFYTAVAVCFIILAILAGIYVSTIQKKVGTALQFKNQE